MSTASEYSFRPPEPLKITGSDAAANWERFHEQWNNYVIAMDLQEASEEKRVAIFLTCIGTEAYDAFRTFELSASDRKKIDPVIAAFEEYCVGKVNVTYERYLFNKQVQGPNERFDHFFGNLG